MIIMLTDPLPHKNKTFILEWRPAISNYKMEDFEKDFKTINDLWLNWSIWDWQNLEKGDEFYMIKCGEEETGIVMHGEFISAPYQCDDWSGRGRVVYFTDIEPDVMIHPDKGLLLTTGALEAAMPDFQWNGGHSGRVLPEAYANQLRNMWCRHIALNDDAFNDETIARKREWFLV